jgi:hypothetical protein
MTMDLKLQAAPRCIGPGMFQDVIFMISSDKQPAGGTLPFLHKPQTFKRTRPPINYVPGDNDRIGLPGFNMSSDGLESDEIGMNVG